MSSIRSVARRCTPAAALSLAATSFIAAARAEPTGTLEGVAVDVDGRAVAKLDVRVRPRDGLDRERIARSDERGRFWIPGLRAGSYDLAAEALLRDPGAEHGVTHRYLEDEIEVLPGVATFVTVQMWPTRNEVNVPEKQRMLTPTSPAATHGFGRDLVSELPLWSRTDASQALGLAPGALPGPGLPRLRGGAHADPAFIVDGLYVPPALLPWAPCHLCV